MPRFSPEVQAKIAAEVDEALRYAREVLGDEANLKSPRLDAYHERCLEWGRARYKETGISPGCPPSHVRQRIWAEINGWRPESGKVPETYTIGRRRRRKTA